MGHTESSQIVSSWNISRYEQILQSKGDLSFKIYTTLQNSQISEMTQFLCSISSPSNFVLLQTELARVHPDTFEIRQTHIWENDVVKIKFCFPEVAIADCFTTYPSEHG